MGIFGVFGCSRGLDLSDEEWNQRLIDALEPLDHVAELRDFSYSKQGMFSRDSAWVSGIVVSDTDDESANRDLLDEVGRQIVTVHQENYSRRSWVRTYLRSPGGEIYEFKAVLESEVVSLDDLAEHYNIPRHG